jgi:hypothetical protein
MMKLAIDGTSLTGMYRVDCECGDHWSGDTHEVEHAPRCPAMPIAECIAHMRLCHPDNEPDIRFSRSFTDWLQRFWEHYSRPLAQNAVTPF